MQNRIKVNIPIPAGERISVRIIEAYVSGGSLYIEVEDSQYRIASGEFPEEATQDNITARLLKSTIGTIKPINSDVLIGKQIGVDVVPDGVIDEVIYCETYEEYEEKYLKSEKHKKNEEETGK